MKLKTSKKLQCITVLLAFTMLLTIIPGHSVAANNARVEGEGTINGYDYEFGMKTITESNVTEENYEETEIGSYTEIITEPADNYGQEHLYENVSLIFEVDTLFNLKSVAVENSTFSATGFVVLINGSNLALAYVGLESMTGTFNFTATLDLNMNITMSLQFLGIDEFGEETPLESVTITAGVVISVELTFEVELTWYGALQVISQAMVTPDNSFMIWQNMMQDFLVYKDVNHNDVFDLDLEQLDVGEIMIKEFKGMGRPGIFELHGAYDATFKISQDYHEKWLNGTIVNPPTNTTEESDSGIIDEYWPEGFDTESIDMTTTWSATAEEGVTTFEWSVEYENMPTYWAINDSEGTWHEGGVEQNYKYGYKYVIDDSAGTADLSTTFTMSEMPAGELKTAASGRSLAVPTYATFLTVNPVESSMDDTVTNPVAEVFSVSYQDEIYAEYDFTDPEKDEYLWSLGTSSGEYIAKYASINVAVIEGRMHGTSILEEDEGGLDWLLFADGLADALQDTGEQSYDFVLALNLFTTNYHKWSGGAITHDPVMRAYFLSTEDGGGDDEFEMPAALALGALAAVIAVLFFVKMRGGKETGEW